MAPSVKKKPAMQETRVGSLDREDPLEEEMATIPVFSPGIISWTEEPARLYSMGSQRVGHNLATKPPGRKSAGPRSSKCNLN